jgi:hypothetical protein
MTCVRRLFLCGLSIFIGAVSAQADTPNLEYHAKFSVRFECSESENSSHRTAPWKSDPFVLSTDGKSSAIVIGGDWKSRPYSLVASLNKTDNIRQNGHAIVGETYLLSLARVENMNMTEAQGRENGIAKNNQVKWAGYTSTNVEIRAYSDGKMEYRYFDLSTGKVAKVNPEAISLEYSYKNDLFSPTYHYNDVCLLSISTR